jgi:hypothetical protein
MKTEQEIRHIYTSSFIENMSCIVPIPGGADERHRFPQVGKQSRDFPDPFEQLALSRRPLSFQSLKLALIGFVFASSAGLYITVTSFYIRPYSNSCLTNWLCFSNVLGLALTLNAEQ